MNPPNKQLVESLLSKLSLMRKRRLTPFLGGRDGRDLLSLLDADRSSHDVSFYLAFVEDVEDGDFLQERLVISGGGEFIQRNPSLFCPIIFYPKGSSRSFFKEYALNPTSMYTNHVLDEALEHIEKIKKGGAKIHLVTKRSRDEIPQVYVENSEKSYPFTIQDEKGEPYSKGCLFLLKP